MALGARYELTSVVAAHTICLNVRFCLVLLMARETFIHFLMLGILRDFVGVDHLPLGVCQELAAGSAFGKVCRRSVAFQA